MPIHSRDPILLHGQQVPTVSTAGEEYRAIFGENVSAGLIGSLGRLAELQEAEQGVLDNPTISARTGVQTGRPPDSPKLTYVDALRVLKDSELDTEITIPQSGIRQRTLDILVSRKREELKRQTILSQSPGGFGRLSGRLASAVAGSLVDPTNIALGFIPVVGEVRYAALLARAGGVLGRSAVRTGVGAIEGIAGAALVEPFNLAANRQQQADYDAYDSMLNVASGAIFGSALHAGAGLLGDVLQRGRSIRVPVDRTAPDAAPQAPLEPVVTAGQDMPTQTLDVNALALARERVIVLDRLAEGRPVVRQQALDTATQILRTDIEADLLARASGVADAGVIAAARADLAVVTRELGVLDTSRRELVKEINARPNVTRKQAERLAREQLADRTANLEGRKARAQAQIAANTDAVQAVEALSALNRRGKVPEAFRAQVDAEADRIMGSTGEAPLSAAITASLNRDAFRNVRPYIAQLPAEVQQNALRMAVGQAVMGRPIDVTPAILAHFGDLKAASDTAVRNAGEVAGADRIAADNAELRLKQARPDNIQTLQEAANDSEMAWREQATAAGMTKEEIAEALEPSEQAASDAIRYVNALKIAALCTMRIG